MVQDVYSYIPFIVSLCLYFLVGTVGNILIIIVYWRERVKLSHTLFIRVLSLIDLTICCLIIPYTITFELHVITIDFFCRFIEFIRHVLIFYSNFMPIAIATERYFAVCKPLKKLSYEKLRLTLTIGLIICVVYAAPAMTIFGVCIEEECVGLTKIRNEIPQTGNSSTYNETSVIQQTTSGYLKKEEFCQFQTNILGQIGSYVYQTTLLLSYVSAFVIIATFYTLVYRVVIKRARRRRNRIGPIRLSVLETSTGLAKNKTNKSGSNNRPTSQTKHTHVDTLKTAEPSEASPQSVQSSRPASSPQLLQLPNTSHRIGGNKVNPSNVQSEPRLYPSFGSEGKVQRHGLSSPSSSKSQQLPTLTVQTANNSQAGIKKARNIGHGQTGTMLFICTFIYIMCWVPFWIDVLFSVENLAFRYIFLLGHVTNPIVYGVVSKAVRDEIWALLLSVRSKLCRRSDVF